MTTSESVVPSSDLVLLKNLCKALDDKKAGDLKLLAVGPISSVTDYIVIGTALAEPHLRALRISAEQVFDAAGVKIASIDTRQESGWLIVDAYQVMVHFFTAEFREKYALEQLWRDGTEISVADLIADKPLKPIATPKRRPVAKVAKLRTKPSKKAGAKKPVTRKPAPKKRSAPKKKK